MHSETRNVRPVDSKWGAFWDIASFRPGSFNVFENKGKNGSISKTIHPMPSERLLTDGTREPVQNLTVTVFREATLQRLR